MTPYSRVSKENSWENGFPKREWLYQTPLEILIKASNGASDFGNKFGQPLIAGSVLTFEHQEGDYKLGYDKVIMQAGGIGFGKKDQAQKETPQKEIESSSLEVITTELEWVVQQFLRQILVPLETP